MSGARRLILTLALGLGLFGSVPDRSPAQPAHDHGPAPTGGAPGEGVICGWAIYTALAEVAARCFSGENPAYQAEINEGLARLDAYVQKNTPSITAQQIAAFKREHGFLGMPSEELCKSPAAEIYRAIEASDRGRMRSELDQSLARAGEPTWGGCI